jgi:putative ABC transport system ATP-binding protein
MDNPLNIKKQRARKIIVELRVSCVRVIKILKLLSVGHLSCRLAAFPTAANFLQASGMTNNTILSVEHLHKFFKSGEQTLAVLSDVSFAIEAGSACAIVGPSGSGKTTLIALCAGLERPSEGSVVFNGVAMHGSNEKELAQIRNQFIGFIFQSFQLLPSLTALENVMVPAEIRGENHARSRASDLLQRVGLEGRLHHYPIQLSGGEQQRVAIARAFMNRPKILFADEPTGNLDAETAKDIVRLIFELNATLGTTLILVTHDPDLTRQAGRVLSLRAGRLVGDDGARKNISAS